MIEFMVLAMPRSATTWVANWLTTDRTHCIHDPLAMHHYSDLDRIRSRKHLGVSCTGLALFPDFVNAHPAVKVILHRDVDEINDSLADIGLGPLPEVFEGALDKIEGRHFHWREVFDRPAEIYEYLTGLPFDSERHAELKNIHMEPHRMIGNADVLHQLQIELVN